MFRVACLLFVLYFVEERLGISRSDMASEGMYTYLWLLTFGGISTS